MVILVAAGYHGRLPVGRMGMRGAQQLVREAVGVAASSKSKNRVQYH